jgi:hypothetical protein
MNFIESRTAPAIRRIVPKPNKKSLKIKLMIALINFNTNITAPAMIRYVAICFVSIMTPIIDYIAVKYNRLKFVPKRDLNLK